MRESCTHMVQASVPRGTECPSPPTRHLPGKTPLEVLASPGAARTRGHLRAHPRAGSTDRPPEPSVSSASLRPFVLDAPHGAGRSPRPAALARFDGRTSSDFGQQVTQGEGRTVLHRAVSQARRPGTDRHWKPLRGRTRIPPRSGVSTLTVNRCTRDAESWKNIYITVF